MRKNFPKRIEFRRESAKVRQEERSKRTNKEQIERLIARGAGHCKESLVKLVEKK